MQPTLTPRPNDDPCDVVTVQPDAVRVAPADDGTLAGAFGSPVEPTDTRIILTIEKQLPAA